ncbi:MAG: metallophosphoesterase [Dolichospermum sp.]
MPTDKIVVLSDIHISTDIKTSWYQKSLHESYLSAILDNIIRDKDSIQELILLGDIFDFWTFPPNHRPPTFTDIINANPNILGPNGKLSQVLTALEGRVTYVNGNHDMNVTQDDLRQIKNSSNYQIKYCQDPIYYVKTAGGKKIAFTHGHIFTIFNAPYLNSDIKPLPVGYYITRAVAYMSDKTLQPGQTVADLPDQGAPNGINNLSSISSALKSLISSRSVVTTLLDYIQKETTIPKNEPIILPNGETKTIEDAKELYKNLQAQWVSNYGEKTFAKSVYADFNGTYIPWFAQQSALNSNSDLIVLGHTHFPKLGIKNGLVGYANNGFQCPSSPDILKRKQVVNFTVVDTVKCEASVYMVAKGEGNSYGISIYPAPEDSVISEGMTPPSMDYSCYIIIDNTKGNSALDLMDFNAKDGYYVVEPPQQILPGEIKKFWIQDDPGLSGSKGTATYLANGQTLRLSYSCPTGISPNNCSGAKFFTCNDGVNWGKSNDVKKMGHPFFVKFVL